MFYCGARIHCGNIYRRHNDRWGYLRPSRPSAAPLALDDAPGIHLKIFFIPLEASLLNHKCVQPKTLAADLNWNTHKLKVGLYRNEAINQSTLAMREVTKLVLQHNYKPPETKVDP